MSELREPCRELKAIFSSRGALFDMSGEMFSKLRAAMPGLGLPSARLPEAFQGVREIRIRMRAFPPRLRARTAQLGATFRELRVACMKVKGCRDGGAEAFTVIGPSPECGGGFADGPGQGPGHFRGSRDWPGVTRLNRCAAGELNMSVYELTAEPFGTLRKYRLPPRKGSVGKRLGRP